MRRLAAILLCLINVPSASAADPTHEPLWSSPFFENLAFVGHKVVAFDSIRCQTFEIDSHTGGLVSPPRVTTPQAKGASTCRDALLGDVLLLRGKQGDSVVDPLTRKPLIQLSPSSPDLAFVWLNAGGLVVAIEQYQSHMRPLPARRVLAFARETGRPLWTVALPPKHEIRFPPAFDQDRLYLRLEVEGQRESTLLALRRKDGSRAWHFAGGSLHPRVGRAGVVDVVGDTVVLLEAATGVVRWKHPLKDSIEDAVVGERGVHAATEMGESPRIITLSLQDGHELWRARLPHGPYTTPLAPYALWVLPGRVFHLGYESDEASLLSGFDADTGRPTLSYWLAGSGDVGALVGIPGVLWATQRFSTTVAFDPRSILSPRRVTVSGMVAHAAGSRVRGKSLAGIRVCSIDGCVRIKANGKFSLGAKGRGEIPFWIEGDDWLKSLRGLPRLPSLTTYRLQPERMTLDAEATLSAHWNPSLRVDIEQIPIR
jgi:hypothetical protein